MSDKNKKIYDVVIVGAGPAGATLARMLDCKKYGVLVIDGSEHHEKVCGGLVSPDAQYVLAKYDICLPSEILASPQLFSVRTIDLSDGLTRYYRRNYLNVNREKFDDFLRGMIPESADIIKSRCEAVVRESDGFSVTLADGTEVRCKYLVGADGASSVVRRSLFGSQKIHKYTAIQEWYEDSGENPYYSCIFDNDTSDGCSWIFFKDGEMVFGGAFDIKNSREAFEAQKEKLVKLGVVPESVFLAPKKIEACLVSRPKIRSGIFLGDDRAFLIGEAAGFISPSSFEGISYALLSAEMLASSMNVGDSPEKIKKKYRKSALKLRFKVIIKCVKRPFMYNRFLRRTVMKSGVTAIK
ncbi:MAG: FAD-binding protein [Ruminococcaceae bacterium]|nr:FAD-binding protein [Oscillospiraceae bacterium]